MKEGEGGVEESIYSQNHQSVPPSEDTKNALASFFSEPGSPKSLDSVSLQSTPFLFKEARANPVKHPSPHPHSPPPPTNAVGEVLDWISRLVL